MNFTSKTGVKITDDDAVSLYPSGQKRTYYPTGSALTLTDKQIAYYNIKSNLFKITESKNSID